MAADIVRRISASGLSIYHADTERSDLFLGNLDLECLLNKALAGESLDYPLQTRSKIAMSLICKALGYPVPERFQRTRPRFPGQNFDAYVQKSNNLQIWNDSVSISRRYVLIRVDDHSVITCVRVISGEALAELDTTGTLTQKYQAKSRTPVTTSLLASAQDTAGLQMQRMLVQKPIARRPGVLPIAQLFKKLRKLVGTSIPVLGRDQERNRGGALHQEACRLLGLAARTDTGQFPDVLCQLLEIKLQTAPTIDLGLVSPDDTAPSPPCRASAIAMCATRSSMPQFKALGRSFSISWLLPARISLPISAVSRDASSIGSCKSAYRPISSCRPNDSHTS